MLFCSIISRYDIDSNRLLAYSARVSNGLMGPLVDKWLVISVLSHAICREKSFCCFNAYRDTTARMIPQHKPRLYQINHCLCHHVYDVYNCYHLVAKHKQGRWWSSGIPGPNLHFIRTYQNNHKKVNIEFRMIHIFSS